MSTLVIKRNGEKEEFSYDKIKAVVLAAGLSPEKSEILTANLKATINNLNVSEISSLTIRDEVLKELEKLDEYSANMFRWYQKTKDK